MSLMLCASVARAGNLDSYHLGNEAALSGGAVVALGEAAGMLWYNPAGIASARRNAIDVTASAFVLRARTYPGLVDTFGFGIDQYQDVSSIEYLSVPTALVYVRQLSDSVTFAAGLFVPTQDELKLEDVVRVANVGGTGFAYEQRIGLTTDEVEYHVALGFGFELSPRFRLGVSLIGTYGRASNTGQFWVHFTDPNAAGTTDGTEIVDVFLEERTVGLRLKVGMQWEFADRWHLGLTVESPQLQLYQWGDASVLLQSAVTVPGQPASSQSQLEQTDLEHGPAMSAPLKVTLGIAHAFQWGWLALEGDFLPALRDDELGVQHEAVGNVRFGARFGVSETLAAGVGIFTDLSQNPTPTDVADDRVHFVGISGGIEFRTPYPLADKPPDQSLIFSTTVGLRYAIGFGETGAIQYELEADEPLTIVTRSAIFHDVAIHVGSAIHF